MICRHCTHAVNELGELYCELYRDTDLAWVRDCGDYKREPGAGDDLSASESHGERAGGDFTVKAIPHPPRSTR